MHVATVARLAMQVYHQGTSQFKGVSWAERSKKWRGQLWFGNKVLSSCLKFINSKVRADQLPGCCRVLPQKVGLVPVFHGPYCWSHQGLCCIVSAHATIAPCR